MQLGSSQLVPHTTVSPSLVPHTTVSPSLVPHTTVSPSFVPQTTVSPSLAAAGDQGPVQSAPPQVEAQTAFRESSSIHARQFAFWPLQFPLAHIRPHSIGVPSDAVGAPHTVSAAQAVAPDVSRPPHARRLPHTRRPL